MTLAWNLDRTSVKKYTWRQEWLMCNWDTRIKFLSRRLLRKVPINILLEHFAVEGFFSNCNEGGSYGTLLQTYFLNFQFCSAKKNLSHTPSGSSSSPTPIVKESTEPLPGQWPCTECTVAVRWLRRSSYHVLKG